MEKDRLKVVKDMWDMQKEVDALSGEFDEWASEQDALFRIGEELDEYEYLMYDGDWRLICLVRLKERLKEIKKAVA